MRKLQVSGSRAWQRGLISEEAPSLGGRQLAGPGWAGIHGPSSRERRARLGWPISVRSLLPLLACPFSRVCEVGAFHSTQNVPRFGRKEEALGAHRQSKPPTSFSMGSLSAAPCGLCQGRDCRRSRPGSWGRESGGRVERDKHEDEGGKCGSGQRAGRWDR